MTGAGPPFQIPWPIFNQAQSDTTHVVSHRESLGHMVCTSLSPLPWKRWEAIDREVKDMLQLGVIDSSTCAWQSPIVLVPKSDVALHFCINLGKVNKVARFDVYIRNAQKRCLVGSIRGGSLCDGIGRCHSVHRIKRKRPLQHTKGFSTL